MTADEREDFRWIVTATYRSRLGPTVVEFHIEELVELDRLIERGPDWNALEEIVIRLNPRCATYPGSTVEDAEER